jgi:hypothetical protein
MEISTTLIIFGNYLGKTTFMTSNLNMTFKINKFSLCQYIYFGDKKGLTIVLLVALDLEIKSVCG